MSPSSGSNIATTQLATPPGTDASSPALTHGSSVSSSSSESGPASSPSMSLESVAPFRDAIEHGMSSDSSAGSNAEYSGASSSWQRAVQSHHVSRPYRVYPSRTHASKRRLSDSHLGALPKHRKFLVDSSMLGSSPAVRSNSPTMGYSSAADWQRARKHRAFARQRLVLRSPSSSPDAPMSLEHERREPVQEDALPELRLLSATRTAPIGWSQLASTPRWTGLLGAFDERREPPIAPELERYWPVSSEQLESIRLSPTLAEKATVSTPPPPLSPKSTLAAIIKLTAAQDGTQPTAPASPNNDYFNNWETHLASKASS